MSLLIDTLRRRAGWIFAAGWVLILLAIAFEFLASVASAIRVFYHPMHRDAPFIRFDLDASPFAIAILIAIGIAATILFWRKYRAAALAVMIAGFAALYIGLAVAKLFIMPGPAQHVRHLGTQRFIVPWQYQPGGSDRYSGLSIFVCWNDMRGSYEDNSCHSRQIRIEPKNRGLTDSSDFRLWEEIKAETKREQDQHGLEVFNYTPASERDRVLAATYFIGRNAAGEVTRFVRCNDVACHHEALIGDYRLLYVTNATELAKWQETDRKIAALVDSWRAP